MSQFAIKKDEEEQAIKRRLFYDGNGTGEDKKIVSLMKSVTGLCLAEQHSDDDYNKALNAALRDISSVTTAFDRQLKISARCERTMRNLEKEMVDKEGEIVQIKDELSKLELELEYVEKLKKIATYPDCQTTDKAIKEVLERKENLQTKVVQNRQHLEVLIESCRNLRKLLDDEITMSYESV